MRKRRNYKPPIHGAWLNEIGWHTRNASESIELPRKKEGWKSTLLWCVGIGGMLYGLLLFISWYADMRLEGLL